jgi:hypothetical protein
LKGYHLLAGSSGRLAIRARGLVNEMIVVMYLGKSIVRISSWSVEERGIKTSQFSASIGATHLEQRTILNNIFGLESNCTCILL